MARNTAVGTWETRAERHIPVELPDGNDDCAIIIVEQADMLDKHRSQRYEGGAYRVRLTNVPGMRTKTFLGESAHHAAARYAGDAAVKCGARWWIDL